MNTKDDQVTLRLPAELAKELAARARATGMPKSHVVREALQAYLATPTDAQRSSAWQRVSGMVGSLSIDSAAVERDALASQLRAHNWRE